MCTGVLAAAAQDAMAALALIAVVLFGFQAWINNVQTLPSDYFPDAAVGSVTGLGGVGAGIGSILLTQATGLVVDRTHSYTPVLICCRTAAGSGHGTFIWPRRPDPAPLVRK